MHRHIASLALICLAAASLNQIYVTRYPPPQSFTVVYPLPPSPAAPPQLTVTTSDGIPRTFAMSKDGKYGIETSGSVTLRNNPALPTTRHTGGLGGTSLKHGLPVSTLFGDPTSPPPPIRKQRTSSSGGLGQGFKCPGGVCPVPSR